MSSSQQKKERSLRRFFIQTAVKSSLLRPMIITLIKKAMKRNLVENNPGEFPLKVQQDKIQMGEALLWGIHRNMKKENYSKRWIRKYVDIHIRNFKTRQETVRKAKERIGFEPPLFITISPEKKCNLKCDGCYAWSTADARESLDFQTFDRVLKEKRELWGSYFTVISGGEPFLWESDGVRLVDLAEIHDDQFFLVYTNGTLIDRKMAERLASLGNLIPAISVEGYEEETDKRRGKGIYNKLLETMSVLREYGVPFGVSITATNENWDLVSSGEFFDFWFEEQGATLGWIFQYMPIGKEASFESVVSPKDRLEMLKRMWQAVREKKYFIADFWNSATTTSGCIAGGRPGGYFYITWNADVTPCVFIPYADSNIRDIFNKGGTLDDVLLTPMMDRIRNWQASYGFTLYKPDAEKKPAQNWLSPCFIRDHYQEFINAAKTYGIKPIDKGAEEALESEEYQKKMIDYGRDFCCVSSELWENFYNPSKIRENK
jgi:MoaA/NifB/PqqE/SkfB family radical SAM enzyme